MKDQRDLEPAVSRLKKLMSTHSMGLLLQTFAPQGGGSGRGDKPLP